MDIVNLILTLIIAILGGYLASKKKVPAAYMLGALFLVAIFNIFFNRAFLPNYFTFVTQIATGTFIGSKFRSEGIMDISLIAYDFKANTSQVALLQLIRLISVISFVPFFTKKCYEKNNKKNISFEQEIKNEIKEEEKVENKSEKSFLFTIIVGIIGGIIGYFSHLPAGTMSCSMALVAYFNVKTHKAYMSLTLRKIIQSFGGALIGAKVTLSDVIALKDLVFPIILIIIGFCLMNVFVGFFLYKTTKFSLSTALLSASPGGMSDISLMAEDLGANGPQVASMQFLRAIFIVGVYPIIIKILFS